jgi:GAF domain-containing protein
VEARSPGLSIPLASHATCVVIVERVAAGQSRVVDCVFPTDGDRGLEGEGAVMLAPVLMSESPNDEQLRRLLDVRRTFASESNYERLLERVLEEGRAITGARYAALGVIDQERVELERFLTSGVDPATRGAIGEPPRGRGVLGVLMLDPQPLRLADVAEHPDSYGFPAGHPPMRSFLGVPIMIGGEVWGNLYFAEKEDAREFSEADERAVVVLAEWAAEAIENVNE